MSDIEVVIKIPEEEYDVVQNEVYHHIISHYIWEAVKNGVVLPKGHGILKDVTNLMRGLYTDMQTIEETFTSSDVYKMIDEECPTIIEADKGASEE